MNGRQVDERIAIPLTDMSNAMKKENLQPLICSGYRTVERQMELFQEYITDKMEDVWSYEDAFYSAKTRIAVSGTSEHQITLEEYLDIMN